MKEKIAEMKDEKEYCFSKYFFSFIHNATSEEKTIPDLVI